MKTLYSIVLLYLAAGLVTLLIETRSPLREWLRRRRDPDDLISLIEAQDPRSKTLWYWVRARVLAPFFAAIAMMVLWPSVLWWWLRRWLQDRELRRRQEARIFRVRPDYLRERMSVEEVERREVVHDPLRAVPDLPFGHLHTIWRDLKSGIRPGDELWSFSAHWDDDWARPHLHEGYVLWRNGRAAGHVLTVYKPLQDIAARGGCTLPLASVESNGEIELPDFLRRQPD